MLYTRCVVCNVHVYIVSLFYATTIMIWSLDCPSVCLTFNLIIVAERHWFFFQSSTILSQTFSEFVCEKKYMDKIFLNMEKLIIMTGHLLISFFNLTWLSECNWLKVCVYCVYILIFFHLNQFLRHLSDVSGFFVW